MGFGFRGLGVRGFGLTGSGFRAYGFRFGVQGQSNVWRFGCRANLGFMVLGSGASLGGFRA